MQQSHNLKVKHITRETDTAVSIAFEVPESLQNEFQFEAGQYITLEKEINGKKVRRAYSLCSTPESGELCVAVKAVKDGAFSQYANSQLKAGDTLKVFTPEGKFTLSPNPSNQKIYAAFAAGSGITPVISILKTVLEKEPQSSFLLVYGNKSPEQTIFLKQLMDLQSLHPERFFLELVFSQAQEKNCQFGRISTSIANYFLKNKYKHLSIDKFYLCGPEGMIEELKNTLKSNGIAEKNIKFELFTSTDSGTVSANADGTTSLSITLDDEVTTFVMPQSKSVLDAALSHDLDPPYSCQGGICSSCIARITEGKAEMRKNQILTDGEIAEGLILTCQAHPTTPVLKVDYDDV